MIDCAQREFTNPTTRLSDDMNHINPAHCTEALVELMLGGIPVGRIGYPLHCRLRYFDLVSRRHFSAASAVASSVSVFQSRELVGQAFLLAE